MFAFIARVSYELKVKFPIPVEDETIIGEETVILPVPELFVLAHVTEQVGVVLEVVIVTLVAALNAVTILEAVVASIVTSVGSINHIPPLPALMLDRRLIV